MSDEQEHQLRQLAVLNDVFSTLSLETTPPGLLQRLLEGGGYITKAEFGLASCRFSDGTDCFAQIGLRITPEAMEKIHGALWGICEAVPPSSSKTKIHQDGQIVGPIAPLLPPVGSMRGICLFRGDKKVGFLILCHSRPDFDFMRGENGLVQLAVQVGLMAEKFDLFQQIEKKSKDLEEVNRHLALVLAESEEKNRRLNEANQAVQRSKAELESFVYSASHDLKAPVVSLHGMASVLMEDYGKCLDDQGRHYLQRLMANANFMETLIADLLEFSRIGRREQRPERLQTDKVIQNVLDQCTDMTRRRKAVVRAISPLPEVFFDATLLTQLFLNLITNGIKFMGDQPDPIIEIGGREVDGKVEFYVKDNGIGIDPEHHDRIFGVFQRLKEVEVEGTGVGLAIVKKIVDMAQGRIWVESQKGKGATFIFQLPQVKLSE